MCRTPKTPLLIVAGLASVAHAGKYGAASPRRFLLLHGSGTTAGAFLQSKTATGGKEFLTGVPCRVDAGQVAPPNWLYSALDAGSDDGSWWKDASGVAAAVAGVEDAIREREAVGVIGHEQGATLAAIVAARGALGEVGSVPLQFAVVCGGAMPAVGPYAELFTRLRDTPSGAAALPTLHCLSRSDGGYTQGEELAACFGSTAEVLWHERGGAMPDRSWWEQTRAFPERSIGGGYWCTQFGGPWRY